MENVFLYLPIIYNSILRHDKLKIFIIIRIKNGTFFILNKIEISLNKLKYLNH